jgi:hypothetical protein
MCQNGVTLDDIRRLYGVSTTLEDIELMLPSPLIGDLGILPCNELATESLSENQAEGQETEEVSPSEDVQEREADIVQDIKEEEICASLDVGEEEVSPNQVEKSKEALSLLSSADQQEAREIGPEEPSFYDAQLYTPLLALCLLSQTSNMLDVLTGLEILLHLT